MAKPTKPAAPVAAPKTTPAATPSNIDRMAAARAARGAGGVNDRYFFVKQPEAKIAPQAQVIVNAIEAAGKAGITREALNRVLTGVIQTRQPIERITAYYQKLLTDGTGCVRLERIPSPKKEKAVKAEKPAEDEDEE